MKANTLETRWVRFTEKFLLTSLVVATLALTSLGCGDSNGGGGGNPPAADDPLPPAVEEVIQDEWDEMDWDDGEWAFRMDLDAQRAELA